MNASKLLIGCLGAASLLGCAGPYQATAALKKRAAFDLQCPADSLRVTSLGGTTRGVEGCGQRAVYMNRCDYLGEEIDEIDGPKKCPWILNSDSKPQKSASE